VSQLVEHFFRHEYGKLVATLTRRFGARHLEAIEDAAQTALMRALETWPVRGEPDEPSAWLFRVATNVLHGELRKVTTRRRIHAARQDVATLAAAPEARLDGEVEDDLLRMLLVCCDEGLPPETQLALALKTLCGFGVREIAIRTFASEAAVYKRLARGRALLRDCALFDLGGAQVATRVEAVQRVLYLLFTEGYLSSGEQAIRRELCEEAIRLAEILAAHPVGRTPATHALLALMLLHLARFEARQDAGGLLLLEEQDRSRWDAEAIARGLRWLAESARGETYTRYHAEAGIAAEHCLAATFAETRWDRVAAGYARLEAMAPSPLHRLNRALAVAQAEGPQAGLALVDAAPPSWLEGSYMWHAVLADLHRRCGHPDVAARYRETAIASAPSTAVASLLARRLG